jgi:hypothetical protein
MFEIDLLHTKRLVEAALPHLEASGGSVVAISSVSGREVDVFKQAYGVMKAAVIHYVSGLAFDLAPRGVRANVVSPGNVYFDGGVWQNIEQNNRELFDASIALNPTGRFGTPEEIAYAVVVLASPRAAGSAARTSSSTVLSPVASSYSPMRQATTNLDWACPRGHHRLASASPRLPQINRRTGAARGRPWRVGTCGGPWHSRPRQEPGWEVSFLVDPVGAAGFEPANARV